MKRQIDVDFFKKEAKKTNVSVHLLIKRFLNYRVTKDNRNCINCRYANPAEYPGWEEKYQCQWVCESKDYHANVDEQYVCNYHDILMKGENDDTQV